MSGFLCKENPHKGSVYVVTVVTEYYGDQNIAGPEANYLSWVSSNPLEQPF